MNDANASNAPSENLAAAVRRLEDRVAALEARLPSGPGAVPARASTTTEDAGLPELAVPRGWAGGFWSGLSLAGRTLLALGGAFLLRAGTDTGTLPPIGGVLAGLIYSIVWIGLADRDAGRARKASAGFYGLTAILVGYPLIWEATTRFGFLTTSSAAVAMTVLTGAALFVAWRRSVAFLAWAFTLVAAVGALGLSFATKNPSLYAGWLVGLGVATLWVGYSRGWLAFPWLAAVAANLAVLRVVLAGSAAGGQGSEIVGVRPEDAQIVAGALVIAYLGSFALRALWKRRDVGAFEILQSAAILLVGLGGATRVAHATGGDTQLLGAGTLAAALISYLVAFLFVRGQLGRGSVFFFNGTLALVLALTGCALACGPGGRTVTWSALGVLAAFLGGRFDRVSLRAHAALYVAAAAKSSALFPAAAGALGGAGESWATRPWAAVALAGAVCAYGILVGTRSYRKTPRLARVPRLVLAVVAIAGLVGAGAILVTIALPGSAVAARTFVLAASAVALAWITRRTHLVELGWITWMLLAVGAVKLLLHDLGGSGSGSLFLAFAFYGAALLLAPRLLRTASTPTSGP